ncbi:MAG: methyltransferase domain-containing protein [Chloroflexi bacterium]|nr:methyltransferase domain-containing protein [Chloroflexota bacterium]
MLDPLTATSRAFDSVAGDYDGPLGNNALIQKMRAQVMDTIERAFPRGARLLDLGCGTGIDAAYLAARGYAITALDSSPAMVSRTKERLQRGNLAARAIHLGIHELAQLDAREYDGAYSNFGALNCVPDLRAVSSALASKLKPGGLLVASVIGRYCPWELAFYTLRGDWNRARVRLARGMVAAPLNGQTVWTRYYSPREFYRDFSTHFQQVSVRALALFVPPPYLVHAYEGFPRAFAVLERLDRVLAYKALFRNAGDHFLVVLTRK